MTDSRDNPSFTVFRGDGEGRQVGSVVELREVLGFVVAADEPVECARSGADYPMLSVFVNGETAVLHWFEEKATSAPLSAPPSADSDIACFQSRGPTAEIVDDKFVPFMDGTGEVWEAPSSVVVSTAIALSCVEEFFVTGERPTGVTWVEL